MSGLKAIGYLENGEKREYFSYVNKYSDITINFYGYIGEITRVEIEEGIQIIVITNQKLQTLNVPSSCTNLLVEYNNLKELWIPEGVEDLNCNFNQIETLHLREGLKELRCHGNKIKKLDLPNSLEMLACDKGVELNRWDLDIVMV